MLGFYIVSFGLIYLWKRCFATERSATKSLSAAYAMFNAFLMCLDFMFITVSFCSCSDFMSLDVMLRFHV
jgi:hypothetical protein